MLSQKARYALHAMIYLARKADVATVAEIAEREAIPRKFLEQVLSALGTRGLVIGRRGPQEDGSAPSRAVEVKPALRISPSSRSVPFVATMLSSPPRMSSSSPSVWQLRPWCPGRSTRAGPRPFDTRP